MEHILHFLQPIPNEIKTLMIATLPLGELRISIPLALLKFKLPIWEAFFLSIIGNMLPVIPILLFLEKISLFLKKYKFFDRLLNWFFDHTRKKSDLIEKYKTIGLMLFVAIPLPATGAWTGAVVAFLFGIKFWHAFFAILFGVIIAGIIVTILTKLGFIGGIIIAIVLMTLVGISFWNFFKINKN
ncbi:MAG: small multi-drug export protein [bacterium]